MKMFFSVFGVAAFLALLYLTYSVKVRIVHSQSRFFGSPHFGWGGGGHKTWVDIEGADVDWVKEGCWWPLFLSLEAKKVILCAKQYLVSPIHYEIFQYEKGEWRTLPAFPTELNNDTEKMRQSSSPFLEKMEAADRKAAEVWLTSVSA